MRNLAIFVGIIVVVVAGDKSVVNDVEGKSELIEAIRVITDNVANVTGGSENEISKAIRVITGKVANVTGGNDSEISKAIRLITGNVANVTGGIDSELREAIRVITGKVANVTGGNDSEVSQAIRVITGTVANFTGHNNNEIRQAIRVIMGKVANVTNDSDSELREAIRAIAAKVAKVKGGDYSEAKSYLNKATFAIAGKIADTVLNLFIPDKGIDNELCMNHSRFYRESVKQFEPWAMHMLDSSSKMPSGLLLGNLVELGNYDECLAVEDVETGDGGKFSGQHCMVRVMLIPDKDRKTHLGSLRKMTASGPAFELSWAVCVPSSCSPYDVESYIQLVMPDIPVQVSPALCSTRASETKLTPLDWFAVGVLALLASLVFCSTCYDLHSTDAGSYRQLLVTFSVYTNGKKLLSTNAGKDSLTSLHGVRCLSMMWVILGHRYMIATLNMPVTDAVDNAQQFYDWNHVIVLNAPLAVDTFLMLSGLLVTYVFLNEMKPGMRFNLAVFYLYRYIRLTPAFALMILLTVTLIPYIGDGPLWRVMADSESNDCVQGWWTDLLYISNYVNPINVCIGQSWYLDVDMQLYWLSPLILYPLWKHPKLGKCLFATFMAIGLVIAFVVPYIYNFSANPMKSDRDLMWNVLYVPAHTRYTPWLIGVGLGYILHKTKSQPTRLSPTVVVCGWVTAVTLLLSAVLLLHRFIQPDYVYERVTESLYDCLSRPGWALGLAWIVFACNKGYGGFINTFLSWEVFMVLGKFTYSMYLVHFHVIHFFSSSEKTALYLTDFIVIRLFIVDLVFSLAAAVVLTLLIESPVMALTKLSMSKSAKTTKKATAEDKVCEDCEESIIFEKVGYSGEKTINLRAML